VVKVRTVATQQGRSRAQCTAERKAGSPPRKIDFILYIPLYYSLLSLISQTTTSPNFSYFQKNLYLK